MPHLVELKGISRVLRRGAGSEGRRFHRRRRRGPRVARRKRGRQVDAHARPCRRDRARRRGDPDRRRTPEELRPADRGIARHRGDPPGDRARSRSFRGREHLHAGTARRHRVAEPQSARARSLDPARVRHRPAACGRRPRGSRTSKWSRSPRPSPRRFASSYSTSRRRYSRPATPSACTASSPGSGPRASGSSISRTASKRCSGSPTGSR